MPHPPVIAIVDDEESVRRALQRLLRADGLTVEAFASGEGFLHSLAARTPDCVLLDLHMPGLDGLAVQDRLTESGVRVPLIFITANEEPSVRERALRAGAVSWLRKPIDDSALLAAIAQALGEGSHASWTKVQ